MKNTKKNNDDPLGAFFFKMEAVLALLFFIGALPLLLQGLGLL